MDICCVVASHINIKEIMNYQDDKIIDHLTVCPICKEKSIAVHQRRDPRHEDISIIFTSFCPKGHFEFDIGPTDPENCSVHYESLTFYNDREFGEIEERMYNTIYDLCLKYSDYELADKIKEKMEMYMAFL